jgi:hypothetical protein
MIWRTENSWPYRDSNSDPSIVQPVASRYTDYAIPNSEYVSWGSQSKSYKESNDKIFLLWTSIMKRITSTLAAIRMQNLTSEIPSEEKTNMHERTRKQTNTTSGIQFALLSALVHRLRFVSKLKNDNNMYLYSVTKQCLEWW